MGNSNYAHRNIKIVIEYDGTRYHGWQSQINARTIQDALEQAIFKLTQEQVKVHGAGRTDAGVHARGQVANFRLMKNLPAHKILMGLNNYLPEDIVIKSAETVPDKFHARFDAKKRIYQYFIIPQKTAVHRRYCWQFFHKMDISVLTDLAVKVTGKHDFSSFARLETQTDNNICNVTESVWKNDHEFLIYRIAANRFLHGMVRALVGTMTDVARGRFAVRDFEEIFQSLDRNRAGTTAPARGLFLEQVIY
ncbi:MAG: tRNA pseudouridine(38-40) synthase TruA [Calditrichaeota bacterium]|nr:tRNA pseudouridine(38-40) synthase TruA [Calditrichota bacterium]